MARQTLNGHRKFRRLKTALGSAIIARGVLELIWDSCYESGDEYIGTAADIDQLIEWTGDPGVVAMALVACGLPEGHGFLESIQPETEGGPIRYLVHDLWHHAPDYVTRRRNRELERRKKSEPILIDRRMATHDGQCPPSPECQDGLDCTPALALAPAQALARRDSLQTVSAQVVVDLWNQLVTAPIPKVTKLTADRKTKIDARLKAFPDLASWRTAIGWINGQDWCRAPGRGEHPNWTATLDWLCKNDGNIQRALERAQVTKLCPPGGTSERAEARMAALLKPTGTKR